MYMLREPLLVLAWLIVHNRPVEIAKSCAQSAYQFGLSSLPGPRYMEPTLVAWWREA